MVAFPSSESASPEVATHEIPQNEGDGAVVAPVIGNIVHIEAAVAVSDTILRGLDGFDDLSIEQRNQMIELLALELVQEVPTAPVKPGMFKILIEALRVRAASVLVGQL